MAQLRIHEVTPVEGWPGTLVEITGEGFDLHRDGNSVIVGNRPALVIRATSERLLVMAAEDARTGEIRVDVGLDSADGPPFEVLPYPEPHDWVTSAAPRFFHGPQGGTPSTNVQNQRVLILPVYPTGLVPPVPPPALLTKIDTDYVRVADYWRTASYGSTTWQFERHPSWLPMPKDGDFYIIGQHHIDSARLSYLAADTRIVGDSGVIFGTSGVGFIPVLHPSPLSWTHLLGSNSLNDGPILAIHKVGNTLYVGTHGGTFAIFNVASPGAATLVGRVDAGDPVWDIALIGTNAVLAQGPGGLGLVDISNPVNPSVLIGGGGANTNWATRVKTVGNRIYSNRGGSLHVNDLTPALNFVNVAVADASDWVMDLAIDGTRCVVATESRGLITFEVTAGGLLEKARHLDFPFLREVRLAGNIAWIAASDQGLAAIDIGNLAAPTTLGSRKFKKDANSLILNGTEAVVAVGSVVLVSVNIANPSTMTLNGTEMATSQNIPMADRRAFLQQRIDGRNSAVDSDRIFIDALRAWFATTGATPSSLDPYEGIAVIFFEPVTRAHSGPSGGLHSWGESIKFNGTKGLFYDDISSDWTVPAHEIVHWLGMGDIYQERFEDGSVIVGTAEPWCMTGDSGQAPLFCAQRLTEPLNWIKVGPSPGDNVRELIWTPTTLVDQTFDIVAHGANQDTDPNRVHALRLVVSSGMTYYIEVRQHAPTGLLFDQTIPAPTGCVLVTRATDQKSVVDNTFERPIQLMGALHPGGTVVDASRNLVITVVAQVQADPLTFTVRVQWNQPIPDNPNGTFDLAITPWDTKTYETPDIWIDSIRRNTTGIYEFNDGDPSKPILSGDRPWVKHENTIHARVKNTGPQKAEDIYVSCYITKPPGIGDNGAEWQILSTQHITEIAPFGEAIVKFTWVPAESAHTCISVAILPKLGEITGGNNRAQENIAVFDSPSGSSHQPVILKAEVRNPFSIGKRVDLIVKNLPDRWHAVVERSHVWLGGKGSAAIRAVIWTDLQSSGLEGERGERFAKPTVEGWTFDGHHYRSIGGILAPVRAVPGVAIDFVLEHGGGAIYIWGHLTPPARQVPMSTEIRDEAGRTTMLYATSDNAGKFTMATPNIGVTLEPGRYTVQVFTGGSEHAAETESDIREVIMEP
jgi:hypothetical protein